MYTPPRLGWIPTSLQSSSSFVPCHYASRVGSSPGRLGYFCEEKARPNMIRVLYQFPVQGSLGRPTQRPAAKNQMRPCVLLHPGNQKLIYFRVIYVACSKGCTPDVFVGDDQHQTSCNFWIKHDDAANEHVYHRSTHRGDKVNFVLCVWRRPRALWRWPTRSKRFLSLWHHWRTATK